MGWGRARRCCREVEIHLAMGSAGADEQQAPGNVGHAQSKEQRGSSNREHMARPVVRFNCSLQQKAGGAAPVVAVQLAALE